ncbi:MAG TPA: hypothetical protein VGR67_09575 [Candidatus Polarisedimenticolia bacterium]|nr:hypothetical protein [Candidatus Polarisedimenticolia bacterium]
MTRSPLKRFDVPSSWSAGILKALVAIALLAHASLTIRGREKLADYPLADDPFYSFAVARHVALGQGITIDGTTATNGFQPLFTFATVPFFWLAGEDRYAPLRYVWILEFALCAATAFLLGHIGRDLLPREDQQRRTTVFLTVALLYLGSADILLEHYNGLETGCLLFFLALVWRVYQLGSEGSGTLWALGAILGLVVLTRVDAVFLVIVIAAHRLLKRGAGGWLRRLREAAILSGVPFLISAPWWIYNYVYFGSLMPTSGQAETAWGLSWSKIRSTLWAFGEDGFPAAYTGRYKSIPTDFLQLLLGILVVWLAIRGFRRFGDPASRRTRRGLAFGGYLLLSCAILAAWYALSSWAIHFYPRYLAPLLLLSTLAFGWMCVTLHETRRWIVLLIGAGLAAEVVVICAALETKWIFLGNVWHDQQLPLVQRSVPTGELVAAGQSGALGYFRDRVVNVDGKVNAKALRFQDTMWNYLDAEGVRWFCDWESYVFQYLGKKPEEHGWKLAGTSGRFFLYRRDVDRSAGAPPGPARAAPTGAPPPPDRAAVGAGGGVPE